jgi:hypothetical protein
VNKLDGPSILITPTPMSDGIEHGALSALSQPTLGMILAIIAIACGSVYVLIYRRRRKLDVGELAFRALSRDMGLSRSQINAVRKMARDLGKRSPLGVLMNSELTSQAINNPSKRNQSLIKA